MDRQTLQGIMEDTFGERADLRERIPHDKDAFVTSKGEIAIFDVIFEEFGAKELSEVVSTAESFGDAFETQVNIFLVTTPTTRITVAEQSIQSRFDFTIKLACITDEPHDIVLKIIKDKMAHGIELDEDDIMALQMIRVMCPPEARQRVSEEVFKIITQLGL